MGVPTVIVAGGLARRMGGGAKLLLPLGDGTILSSLLARLPPEAVPLAVNANGPGAGSLAEATFRALRLRDLAGGASPPRAPVAVALLPDPLLPGVEERPGPLAGLLAATEWAALLGAGQVLAVPGDAPFLPRDLLPRLQAAGAPSVAASAGRLHPVAGLWPAGAAPLIRQALAAGTRRVEDVARALGAAVVDFPRDPGGPDPFLNVNGPADLEDAERWA